MNVLAVIIDPLQEQVYLGRDASFSCTVENISFDALIWEVNGLVWTDYPDIKSHAVGENYTLTVPGKVEYNGSSVQCKARVVGGGIIESSQCATLLIITGV